MRKLPHDRRNQENDHGKRDYEVCYTINRADIVSLLTFSREDDTKWPQKNKDGRQELEIRMGNEHISFEVILSISARS